MKPAYFLCVTLSVALLLGTTPVEKAWAEDAASNQPASAFNAAGPAKPAPHKSKKKKSRKNKAKKKVAKASDKLVAPQKDAPPKEKRGYDPAVAEPTEEIMAIKNKAQRQFWEGRKPLSVVPQSVSGIASAPLQPPQAGATLARASASLVSGVTFDDQPIRLAESEAFRRAIDTVAFELKRPCREHEYLGWPLQQTEQSRVDSVFNDTLAKLRLRGFSIRSHNPASAGGDVSVFTADRIDHVYNRHVLGLWSAGDVGLLLLMCETEPPPEVTLASSKQEVAEKTPAKKTKAKKKKSKPNPAKAAKPEQPAPTPISEESSHGVTDKPAAAPSAKPEVVPGKPAAPEAPALPTPPPSDLQKPAASSNVPVTEAAPAIEAKAPEIPPAAPVAAPTSAMAAPPTTSAPSIAPPAMLTETKASPLATKPKAATDAPAQDLPLPDPHGSSGVQTISYDDPLPSAAPVAATGGGASALTQPGKAGSARSFSGSTPAAKPTE